MTWRAPWRAITAVAIGVLPLVACSGGARPAVSSEDDSGLKTLASPDLLRASTLPSLTPAQGAILCDWTNQVLGGYGRTVACAAGPRATDRDQAFCVSGLPSCPDLTVADIEDCTLAQGVDVCKYFAATACAALRACVLGE